LDEPLVRRREPERPSITAAAEHAEVFALVTKGAAADDEREVGGTRSRRREPEIVGRRLDEPDPASRGGRADAVENRDHRRRADARRAAVAGVASRREAADHGDAVHALDVDR